MGLLDIFRRAPANNVPISKPSKQMAIAANKDDVSLTFADRDITFKGNLSGYDYRGILRSKQKHILQLYELADYYCDADPILHGIVYQVYLPMCSVDSFKLVGSSERVKKKYMEYYDRIHLREKMESVFVSVIKYANCVIYLKENGDIVTLPIHYCRIANVEVDGEPIVEFNCRQVWTEYQRNVSTTKKDWIKDEQLDVRLRGYPKEVSEGIKAGVEWVQLNPENTFVLQDSKEDWMRYAIPFVAGCLIALEKKERISNYEDSLIDLAARSFVHVTYGDDKEEVLPTTSTLTKIGQTFKAAMTGGALAVTNAHAKAVVVQPKTDDVFAYEKYSGVNNDILSAAGISGIIISGKTEDGSSFASAQVSTQTVAIRVRRFRDRFCEIMNKINRRVNLSGGGRMAHSSEDLIPRFTFPPVDFSGAKEAQAEAQYLFEHGVLSHESLMEAYGVDMMQEVERKKHEQETGIHNVLAPSDKDDCRENEQGSGKLGRPTLDDSERTSSPQKSATGRLPKASNPEGSNVQDDVNAVE